MNVLSDHEDYSQDNFDINNDVGIEANYFENERSYTTDYENDDVGREENYFEDERRYTTGYENDDVCREANYFEDERRYTAGYEPVNNDFKLNDDKDEEEAFGRSQEDRRQEMYRNYGMLHYGNSYQAGNNQSKHSGDGDLDNGGVDTHIHAGRRLRQRKSSDRARETLNKSQSQNIANCCGVDTHNHAG